MQGVSRQGSLPAFCVPACCLIRRNERTWQLSQKQKDSSAAPGGGLQR
nr:MAG TPA_asm: hypothetical protein [Caudoviricetes sp.]